MSSKKHETIADIVAEMRNDVDNEEKYNRYDLHEWGTDIIRLLADRIEAAAKREREAGADAAQICGEIGELIGLEAACKETVTDCHGLGNAMKMREEAAIDAPPRNCDIGTDEEQSSRFDAHCRKHMGCLTCPLREKDGGVPKHCELAWAQLPYEEGGVK